MEAAATMSRKSAHTTSEMWTGATDRTGRGCLITRPDMLIPRRSVGQHRR